MDIFDFDSQSDRLCFGNIMLNDYLERGVGEGLRSEEEELHLHYTKMWSRPGRTDRPWIHQSVLRST